MDDDDHDNGGLGGLAYYQLGRWHAESSQRTRELFAHAGGYAPVPRAHYDQAVQLNEALAADNRQVHVQNEQLRARIAALNQSVQAWERDYEKLRAIANTHNDEYLTLMGERDNLKAWVLDLQDELRDLRGEE